MVYRAAPETAHAGAAVVHRVRQHQSIVDADKDARVLAQLRRPGGDHLEQGLEVWQEVGPIGGPVAHLHVDVEMIVARPGRHRVTLDQRALQPGRHAAVGAGQPCEFVHAIAIEEIEPLVGQLEAGHARPVARPPGGDVVAKGLRPLPSRGVDPPFYCLSCRRSAALSVLSVLEGQPQVAARDANPQAQGRVGGTRLHPTA